METRSFAVISTAHIQFETSRWLHQQGEVAAEHWRHPDTRPAIHVASHVYGWLIYCDDEPANLDCPEEIKDIMRFVKKSGHDYVLLDRDADAVDDLPTWEW